MTQVSHDLEDRNPIGSGAVCLGGGLAALRSADEGALHPQQSLEDRAGVRDADPEADDHQSGQQRDLLPP